MSRECFVCGSNKTGLNRRRDGTTYPIWYLNHDAENNTICQKCYVKHFRDNEAAKASNRRWKAINSPKRIQFKGKRIYLDDVPRTGVCSKCGKSVKKDEIAKTNLHHMQYDESNPLAHTVELCVGCHSLETWRLGQHDNDDRSARKWVYNHSNGKLYPTKQYLKQLAS